MDLEALKKEARHKKTSLERLRELVHLDVALSSVI
jgi:hypothetical protein